MNQARDEIHQKNILLFELCVAREAAFLVERAVKRPFKSVPLWVPFWHSVPQKMNPCQEKSSLIPVEDNPPTPSDAGDNVRDKLSGDRLKKYRGFLRPFLWFWTQSDTNPEPLPRPGMFIGSENDSYKRFCIAKIAVSGNLTTRKKDLAFI